MAVTPTGLFWGRAVLLDLQQHDHSHHQQDREEDRPAVEVALVQ
jgi:hypothetical protein